MGDDDADTICNILRVEFDFAAEEFDDITAGCKDFIKKLLVKDPRCDPINSSMLTYFIHKKTIYDHTQELQHF